MKTKILLLFLFGFVSIISGQIEKPLSPILIGNITNIKECAETFFYIGTGIIAYLTYTKAKGTFLQPIRTERQLNSLNELLEYINKQDYLLEKAADYNDIVRLNIIRMLYGFGQEIDVKEFGDKLKTDFEMDISLPCGENKIKKKENKNRLTEEDEKSPIVNNDNGINLIYVTNQYLEFTLKISEFEKDPYMPSKVSKMLNQLKLDIDSNLCVILRKQLEQLRLSYINNEIKRIDLNKQINVFNDARIQHQIIREHIRSEIRKYLMID